MAAAAAAADHGAVSLNAEKCERATAVEEEDKKNPYPLVPMALLMTVTVGQR